MSIVLIHQRNAERWLKALKSFLPTETIEHYPNVQHPEKVEFVVCFRITKEQMKPFLNAKVIQCLGAGINYILEAEVLKKEMVLSRVTDPNLAQDMFEYALSGVLSQMKNLPKYAKQQRDKLWKGYDYKSFNNTTIGILGLGKIGGTVAEKFAALGCRVKGWSNSPKNLQGVESFVGEGGWKDCLKDVDFLINILPLTAKTHQILNAKDLKHLPKGAFLINIGRGMHNNDNDILKLLNEEHLSGVMLDVFQIEPLPTQHPFWTHSKVVITPHIAGVTAPESAAEQIAMNYKRFKKGEILKNVVMVEKGY